MRDYVVRALVSGTVSVYAGTTTNTVEKARKTHHMNPTPVSPLAGPLQVLPSCPGH